MKKEINKIRSRFLFTIFLFICTSITYAQTTIKGKVVDKSNEPLIGVTVKLKGTSQGSITDFEGNYSMKLNTSNGTLVFSYVGYEKQEVKIGMSNIINVTLQEESVALNQVVVVGYGTSKRGDVTGSISSINAEQIKKIPIVNVGEALQGRMPGVQVTNNDGTPGAGVQILIRGIGSFGDNSPLYVIDGYPGASISNLNPSDIQSIDILKDASAAAIYGNRAANGVVIITTKRGNAEKIQLSVDATSSVQFKPATFDVLNAQEFATLATEVGNKENSPVLDAWANPSSLHSIDWQDLMYRSGFKQNYNLSLRGGSEKVQTSVSLGVIDQRGIVEFSNYKRYNAALTQDYKPLKWLKSSTNLRYAYTDNKTVFGSGQGGIGRLAKLIPTMTGNPLTDEVETADGVFGYYDKNANAVRDNENIYARSKLNDKKNISHNLIANTSLEIVPIKGLTLKTNFGINYGASSGYNFNPYDDRVPVTRLATYQQSATNSFEYLWENTVNYSNTFGVHNIDVLGGISIQENTGRNMSVYGEGLSSDGLRNLGALQTTRDITGYQQTWSLASQFARLTYKYAERYILTGTVRRDGSSRFKRGNRWGVFPSVSAAWRVKEEGFLKDFNLISNLKLRASYGEAGNQNIGLFQYESSYTTGKRTSNHGYVFGQNKTYVDGMVQSYLPNSDLKWETSKQTDIGVDLGLFDNKLMITADYYIKKSSDFLLNIQMPAQTGFTSATRNVGSVKNYGFEFNIDYRNNIKNLKYSINANLTTVKNKIEELSPGKDAVANLQSLGFPTTGNTSWAVFSMSRVGGPIGEFYGFQADGIIQSQAEIDALNANARKLNNDNDIWYIASGTAPGDRKFVDQNKDGIITDEDRVPIGSPLPKFYGGINLSGQYKNFDFNLFFNYSVGNKILNFVKRNLISMGGEGSIGLENVSTDFYYNRWTENKSSNKYPRAVWSDVNGNSRVSDAFVENGSYLRAKNIEIGYTLPTKLTQKANISRLRFFASIQNLFTITGYSGMDPEIGQSAGTSSTDGGVTASGIDTGIYPYSKYLSFGLNLEF